MAVSGIVYWSPSASDLLDSSEDTISPGVSRCQCLAVEDIDRIEVQNSFRAAFSWK